VHYAVQIWRCAVGTDLLFVVETSSWTSGIHDHFVAVAEYDFDAQKPDELTFKQGTVLTVAPKGLLIFNIFLQFHFDIFCLIYSWICLPESSVLYSNICCINVL